MPVDVAERAVQTARERYRDTLGTTLPALSRVEGVVANVVTPAGGLAAGIVAGTQYDEATLAIGASMVPVPTIQFPLGFETDGALGGLPLITQNFNRLCERTFNVTFDWIRTDVLGRIPGFGTFIGLPGVSNVRSQAAVFAASRHRRSAAAAYRLQDVVAPEFKALNGSGSSDLVLRAVFGRDLGTHRWTSGPRGAAHATPSPGRDSFTSRRPVLLRLRRALGRRRLQQPG